MVTKVMRSPVVIVFLLVSVPYLKRILFLTKTLLQNKNLSPKILAIPVLAAPTQSVTMVFALASQNIKEILILVVDLNVF